MAQTEEEIRAILETELEERQIAAVTQQLAEEAAKAEADAAERAKGLEPGVGPSLLDTTLDVLVPDSVGQAAVEGISAFKELPEPVQTGLAAAGGVSAASLINQGFSLIKAGGVKAGEGLMWAGRTAAPKIAELGRGAWPWLKRNPWVAGTAAVVYMGNTQIEGESDEDFHVRRILSMERDDYSSLSYEMAREEQIRERFRANQKQTGTGSKRETN